MIKFAATNRIAKPARDGIGVLLIRRPRILSIEGTPQPRVGFNDHAGARFWVPPVKRPEMNLRAGLPDFAQPRDRGMGRFGDGALNIKMKNRFCRPCRFFCQSPPVPLSHPRRTISDGAIPHEIDVGVRSICRPMCAEVVEELLPVGVEAMSFEVAHGERKAVIDADDRGHPDIQGVDQPFGQPAPRSEFLGADRWQDFGRFAVARGLVHPQALQARLSRFGPGIVDADRSAEPHAGHWKFAKNWVAVSAT